MPVSGKRKRFPETVLPFDNFRNILIPMFESGKTTPIIKKAYEISYALCRIAAKIPEKSLADALARQGIGILGSVSGKEYEKMEQVIAATEYFVKLGMGLGFVNFSNSEVLFDEITLLKEMLIKQTNNSVAESADLSGIFTNHKETIDDGVIEGVYSSERVITSVNLNDRDFPETQKIGISDSCNSCPFSRPTISDVAISGNSEISGNESVKSVVMETALASQEDESNNGIVTLIKSGDRQMIILEKIREAGDCRIKDLEDLFHDCSERTIRNDLQSLAEQNLIEKVGTGGPGVFYRSKI